MSPPEADREALRRRAAQGTALLAGRGAFVLVLGVVANVALARLLAPHDFGILALGMTLVVLGQGLADGGLGAALIRRPAAPEEHELAAVNGFQLTLTVALSIAVAAAGVPFGDDGIAIALMVASLPIAVLRSPSVVVLEREVRFREIATVELVEAVVFYGVAVAAVAAGAGLWGVGGAVILRAVAGTALMIRMSPLRLIRPRRSWGEVRTLLGLGARMQGVAIAAMVRDQLLNWAIALVAGVAALGVWSLVHRILRIPQTLFATVGRVSYPTLSRLLAAGDDVAGIVERATATLALATGAVVVALTGVAPALPALLGPEWGEAPETLLWAGLAMTVGGPVWSIGTSFFFAAGEPGTVLRAMLLQSLVWFAVALPLVVPVGVRAVGIGMLAGAAVGGAHMAIRTAQRTGGAMAAALAAPAALAVVGSAVAWAIGSSGPDTVLRGLAGVAAGETILFAGLALLRRPLLRETAALGREAIGGLRRRTLQGVDAPL